MKTTLEKWLDECLKTDYLLAPLPGDASFRQYFRLKKATGSCIVMDASREQASCVPFVAIANALRAKGLQTPEIIAQDVSRGFLVLTDFGHRLYLTELNSMNADVLYDRALNALYKMQHCETVKDWTLPLFTAEFMRRELDLFREWFLEKHLGLMLSSAQQNMLESAFDFLANSAASQPRVFMHRDYHSANLMVLPENEVGILDFQDAFIGPITYDLVSLLRDCYIAWPEHSVTKWVLQFWQKLALPNVSADEFVRWFDLMGLQRHLKALLTFSRKFRRDGNAHYLQHVPRTLQYVLSVSERYDECRALNQFLHQTVVEKCVE